MVCRTYVEDVKDLVEVRLPTGDDIFVVFRMKAPGDFVPPALFHDVFLYFRDGPTAKTR